MLDTIEAKIHSILLDIDPANNDYEEQSVIVAEATANYRLAEKSSNMRKAAKEEEAEIIDCILKAINNHAEPDGIKYSFANDRSLDVEDSRYDFYSAMRKLRISTDKNIINDSDLDIFFDSDEDKDNLLFDITDGCDRHNSDVFSPSGRKKHRSDFNR